MAFDPSIVVSGIFGVIVAVVSGWAGIRAGRNSDKQKQEQAAQDHDLALTDRWREYATGVEDRLNARIDRLAAELDVVRKELANETHGRRTAEVQRDAAIHHAKELREAWPDGPVPLAIPQVIRDFFCG